MYAVLHRSLTFVRELEFDMFMFIINLVSDICG